jgi:hypothetical protein
MRATSGQIFTYVGIGLPNIPIKSASLAYL